MRNLETQNTEMHQKDKSTFAKLLKTKESVIDQKRELELDLMQMADRDERAIQREENRLVELRTLITETKR